MISLLPTQSLSPPPGTSSSGFEAFSALLQIAGDPAAAKKRLGEILDAAMAANDVIRAANEAKQAMSAERKVHDETLLRERATHDRAIADAKAKSASACAMASDEIRVMRADAEKLQAKAKADATASAELRADLERRLGAIKKAAA
jgi:hypothetical protein